MLGVVRLHDDPGGESAEFAILVRSHLKGHGLGWLMMKHMIAYAKAKGLKTVHGQVLAENLTMLKMCAELGFHAAEDPDERGMKLVTLPLDEVKRRKIAPYAAGLRQRALRHQAAGARIDHAERAQRQQRRGLHRFARADRILAGTAPAGRAALPSARRRWPAPRRAASCSGRWPPSIAAPMRAASSAASDWRKSSRTASTCASTGSAITAQASRRSVSARAAKVTMQAASADSGPGAASAAARMAAISRSATRGDQFGDEIGLGREIAIDGAGGDAGALGHRGDLHRAHAALAGDGAWRRRGSPPRARPGGGPHFRCGDRAWRTSEW